MERKIGVRELEGMIGWTRMRGAKEKRCCAEGTCGSNRQSQSGKVVARREHVDPTDTVKEENVLLGGIKWV
jgi:hypothetical protein